MTRPADAENSPHTVGIINEDRNLGRNLGRNQGRARTVAIRTHGCKLNQADSQEIAERFRQAGFLVVESSAKADVVVLNSCTVTATADAKARQFLRRADRANPGALVVATGCYAQRAPADLEGLDAVSLVVGNTQKPDLVERVAAELDGRDAPAAALSVTPARRSRARNRAMIKIQEGCDQVCAYCIVPRVRGRERSIPPERIIGEINHRAEQGCREAVLTGTQLGTYGFDIPGMDLLGLVRRVLEETRIERLRVSSLQAHEITPSLLELWEDQRLCPHFHIPLQSGSNDVLKAMRRRYDTDQFAWTTELVRRAVPGAGVTTDVIVGFPGEDAREFRESYEFARRMGFSDMHVFPYSSRPGTSAAHFGGQVDEGQKRERMGEMLALAAASHDAFRRAQLGSETSVLWETARGGPAGNLWTGLTANYVRVRTESAVNLANSITRARLTELDGDWVTAAVLE